MSNPYGKRYTAEFRRDAVALVNASPGRTVNEIARKLEVPGETLRQAECADLPIPPDRPKPPTVSA